MANNALVTGLEKTVNRLSAAYPDEAQTEIRGREDCRKMHVPERSHYALSRVCGELGFGPGLGRGTLLPAFMRQAACLPERCRA